MAIPIEEQNIIKILGIEALSDERKIAIVEKVSDLVQKRLLVRLFDTLPDQQQEELRGLLKRADQPGLQGFLNKNAPDLGEWIRDEVGKVKRELRDFVKDT